MIGTVFAGKDTVYIAGCDGLAGIGGFWNIGIRDPSTDYRQILVVKAVSSTEFTLNTNWNGNSINNAQVVPYGGTYFRFLTPPFVVFDRSDSALVYDVGGYRLQ